MVISAMEKSEIEKWVENSRVGEIAIYQKVDRKGLIEKVTFEDWD